MLCNLSVLAGSFQDQADYCDPYQESTYKGADHTMCKFCVSRAMLPFTLSVYLHTTYNIVDQDHTTLCAGPSIELPYLACPSPVTQCYCSYTGPVLTPSAGYLIHLSLFILDVGNIHFLFTNVVLRSNCIRVSFKILFW